MLDDLQNTLTSKHTRCNYKRAMLCELHDKLNVFVFSESNRIQKLLPAGHILSWTTLDYSFHYSVCFSDVDRGALQEGLAETAARIWGIEALW